MSEESAPLPLGISSDEINYLVYGYLQDSGFSHSAFTLRSEANLENSPLYRKPIPRGELVQLLVKALLYMEVEAHWKVGSFGRDCRTPWTFFEPHVCSFGTDANDPDTIVTALPAGAYLKRDGTLGSLDNLEREQAVPKYKHSNSETSSRVVTEPKILSPSTAMGIERTVNEIAPSRSQLLDSSLMDVDSDSITPDQRKKIMESPPSEITILTGHTAEVFVCAWNPAKCEVLATGTKDANVRMWDLPAGRPAAPPLSLEHIPKTATSDVTSLDWNSEGTLLATGSYDSILRVWTIEGQLYLTNPQHQGPIFATRFSPSGRWLLSGSLDGTACVWDIKSKKFQKQYRCHADCCLDVDWLDDNTFATCGADKKIQIMRLDQTTPIHTFAGHTHEVNQIKFNPSRTKLASCSDDMTNRIWDVTDLSGLSGTHTPASMNKPLGPPVVLRGHSDCIGSIGWKPSKELGEHEHMASSGFDGTVRIWDTVTGACIKVFNDHKRAAYTLAFSPDSHWLATGSGDGWLYVYDTKTNEKKYSWCSGAEKQGIYEIDWQQNGGFNRLALCLERKAICLIDANKIPQLRS